MNCLEKVLPMYRPNGQPAFGWVKIPCTPAPGNTVTINGDVYAFGVDFFGLSAPQAVLSLVDAINANQNDGFAVSQSNTAFFRLYAAYISGKYIVVYSLAPGSAGNAFTLATNSSNLVVSGATFAGGVDVNILSGGLPPNTGALTDDSGTIAAANTSQQVMAAVTARKYLFIQNLSATDMYFNIGAAATAGPGSILLPAKGSFVYEGSYVPNGTINILSATVTAPFTAKQL